MRRALHCAFLTLFLVFGLSTDLDAGYRPELRFERFTLQDGLPDHTVTAVVQDPLGFLWLGTPNGLVRLDGYDFTTYKPDPEDPASISGRFVKALHVDRSGVLWIGTLRGGLNRFDRVTQGFTAFRHDPEDPASLSFDSVDAIYEDRAGVLWIGTGDAEIRAEGGGLNRFDGGPPKRETGTFTRYLHDPEDPTSLGQDVVSAIVEDQQGRLWVGTQGGGLQALDRESGAFARWQHDPEDPASLASDNVSNLYESRDGTLWVGTWGGGLHRFDPQAGTFERFAIDGRDPGKLAGKSVTSLYEDRRGTLWVGTWRGPLQSFHPEAGTFRRYPHQPQNPASPSDGSVGAILRGRERDPVVRHLGRRPQPARPLSFEVPPHQSRPRQPRAQPGRPPGPGHPSRPRRIPVDRHPGRHRPLAPGDRGGDDLSARSRRPWSPISTSRRVADRRHPPGGIRSLGANYVTAIHQGPSGAVWIGTKHRGVDRWDPASGEFTHHRHDPDDPASLGRGYVTSVLEDRQGALWVGVGGNGLHRLDPVTGEFTHYRHDPDDPASLGQDWIITLHEDREGTLWIGAEGSGLLELESGASGAALSGAPGEVTFTQHFSPLYGLDMVLAIHEDAVGRLWVGTYNGGLHLFDRATGTSEAITERDGLAHDTVHAILEDEDGDLWLTTGAGVSRFDPDRRRFRNYGVRHGLQRQLGGAGERTAGGELLFAGNDGINAIHPAKTRDNPIPPTVALTGFKVFDQPVRPGGDELAADVSIAEEVSVPHRANVVTFEFAALHYSHPASNRYAFRLDPFSHDWTEVDASRRQATYTNLSPGRYTFRVKAANADGVWGGEEATVDLVVRPPWWRTWWAPALYGLLAVGLVAAVDRLQRVRVVRRERQEAEKREARLRAEAAELQARAAEAQSHVLQAENDRKTQQLEEARRVQLSMLPKKVPWHPDVEIVASMTTAAEVGGRPGAARTESAGGRSTGFLAAPRRLPGRSGGEALRPGRRSRGQRAPGAGGRRAARVLRCGERVGHRDAGLRRGHHRPFRGESLKAAPALERAVAEDPAFTLAWVRLSQA